MADREIRKHLLNAIGAAAEARGWLSTSAPKDKNYPTERITEAIVEIGAALEEQGGELT